MTNQFEICETVTLQRTVLSQELLDQLFNHFNILEVKFVKSDQTIRTINCVKNPPLESQQYVKKTTRVKKPNPSIAAVWDIDLNEWRSFRFDRIVEISDYVFEKQKTTYKFRTVEEICNDC